MKSDSEIYGKPTNGDYLIHWNHIISIFIYSIPFIAVPCLCTFGFQQGLIQTVKVILYVSAFVYPMRILMHENKGVLRNFKHRGVINWVLAITGISIYLYLAFSVENSRHGLIARFIPLIVIIPIFASLYYNFILGKKGPIDNWP